MPLFSPSLPIVAKDLDRNLARKVIQVTAIAHSELTTRTPVQYGWARANWTPGLGPAAGTVGGAAVDKAPDTRGTFVGAASARSEHGLAQVISGYKSIVQGVVWIVNNVTYIRALNEGHKSKSKFVEAAIQATILRAGLTPSPTKANPVRPK